MRKKRCAPKKGKLERNFLLSKTGVAKVGAYAMKEMLERALGTPMKVNIAPIPDSNGLAHKLTFMRAGVECEATVDVREGVVRWEVVMITGGSMGSAPLHKMREAVISICGCYGKSRTPVEMLLEPWT